MGETATMYLFAGPDGSGKSTLLNSFFGDTAALNKPYYCTGALLESPALASASSIETRKIAAARQCEQQVIDCIADGKPFVLETVLSSDHKWKLLDAAQEKNYKIVLLYVTTEEPEVNVARMRYSRPQQDPRVQRDVIQRRYGCCHDRLGRLLTYTHEAHVYDNSLDDARIPLCVLEKDRERFYVNGRCRWIMRLAMRWFAEELFSPEDFSF